MNKKYKKLILISALLSVTTISGTVFAMNGKGTTKTNNVQKSPSIVIYNSHCDEKYLDGNNVITVSQELNKLLIKGGQDSVYLKNKKSNDYVKSYDKSRELITKNMSVGTFTYEKGVKFFNQNLSNKAIMVEVGNECSSKKDIQECISSLSDALKGL